ncbi:hypothetical protein QT381_12295 [Galbitalea sp. SE-J8]|uniref:hypothetical protein n=1 Tax=Galbitalea sp. SE-J8 TaxID=3054952 RepID=UPI00259CD63B|nr:hypothetical protein [Galbitalea sp. SE-J8]MDM4763788.1 hypothetical protein [Galbitalea sp. SE-J8]
MRRRFPRIVLAAATSVLALSTLAACDGFNPPPWANPNGGDASSPAPTSSCSNFGYDSLFSQFGTVKYSYVLADNLTLYLDMWTEQPTHSWYADTPKKLTYTIQVVDSNARPEDAFKFKRKVYLSAMHVTATTVEKDNQSTVAYELDKKPAEVTLDPEALQSKKYGLLITSPKGGLLYQNTEIDAVPDDTYGLNLDFQLTVNAQAKLASKSYDTSRIDIALPIAIFSAATQYTSTSCASNATMAPSYAPGVTP